MIALLLVLFLRPQPIYVLVPPPPHLKRVVIDGRVYFGYRVEVQDASKPGDGIVIIDPLRPMVACRITHRSGRWFCR